jgi:hypothetical protein
MQDIVMCCLVWPDGLWWTDGGMMISSGQLKNSVITWSRVFLEKLIVSQLVKKFSAFCGTQMFITTFTRSHHLFIYGTR